MHGDPYAILGISVDASRDEIKRAYRLEAKRWHPDVNPDPRATERFREVQEAYDLLCDSDARASYDQSTGPAEPPDPYAFARTSSPWAMMADLLAALRDDPFPTPARRAAMGDTEVIVDEATGTISIRRTRGRSVRVRIDWEAG